MTVLKSNVTFIRHFKAESLRNADANGTILTVNEERCEYLPPFKDFYKKDDISYTTGKKPLMLLVKTMVRKSRLSAITQPILHLHVNVTRDQD